MRLPFLASFIVFIIWLSYEISKSRRAMEKQQQRFWERERQANRTRRKSLDGLDYIAIPLDRLPMELCADQPEVADCLSVIRTLAGQTVVNLTGYSNTDLKLMYGAPNINLLTEYDQNYTLLARTLQKWAVLLYDQGFLTQARSILEFAVSTRTDVSGTYKLLAAIYRSGAAQQDGADADADEKIGQLIAVARTLRSSMGEVIVRTLQESDPSNG